MKCDLEIGFYLCELAVLAFGKWTFDPPENLSGFNTDRSEYIKSLGYVLKYAQTGDFQKAYMLLLCATMLEDKYTKPTMIEPIMHWLDSISGIKEENECECRA